MSILRRVLLHRLHLLLLFCVLPIAISAQNAKFVGQIADPQNAVIPHASVEITNQETGVQLTTVADESGNFTFPYLTAGRYRIVVQATGFNVSAREVTLGMGQTFIYNVQLTVGGNETTVSVRSGTEITQLQLENSEINSTITGKEVSTIQLNGRNFTQMIALAPGVSNQTQQDEARVGMAGSVAYSVNGGRTEYNSFQVDGSETLNVGINKDHSTLIVYPSIDAIQEIKVLTSNYGAMYPSTGNGTTLVTTKSGGDHYHGSLYEFFRNEVLNAKGYFDVGHGAPLYRRNDFGGTIGGPISIPHLFDGKAKSHFFFSEESRVEKDPYPYRQAVPSLEERNGDFSDVCPSLANGAITTFSRTKYPDCPEQVNISDSGGKPTTFVSNQIAWALQYPTALNQNAVALLNNGIFPLPNSTTGCNGTAASCYLADVSLPTNWREELFRIDHTINQKNQLSFRYIHDEWSQTTSVPQYAYTQNTFPTIQNRFYAPGISLAAKYYQTLTPTWFNEITASYTNSHINLNDAAGNGTSLTRPAILDSPCTSTTSACGMTSIFSNNSAGSNGVAKMPGITIAGNNAEYGGLGFSTDPGYMPWEHSNPTYSLSDNMSKIFGHHNLQFGAQWVVFQRNQLNGPIGAASGDTQGLLTFSNLRVKGSTGNAFSDFLYNEFSGNSLGGTGAIASFQQDSAQARYRQRYHIIEPFVQDDYKITSHLTLNLGLRLSLFGNFSALNHNAWNWEPSAYNSSVASSIYIDGSGAMFNRSDDSPVPIYLGNGSVNPVLTNGLVQCGVNGVPSSCMSSHLVNPAPRIGFAWDPTGSGKIAIRGGYGIFFEHGTADEANSGSLEGSAPVVLSMNQISPLGWGQIGTVSDNEATVRTSFPVNVTAIPVKTVWPYVQQWSASIEHSLPGNMLGTVAYVGSKGTHLTTELESNQLAPISGQNPFAAHQPLIIKGTDSEYSNGTEPNGDCTNSGVIDSGAYTLLNGDVVGLNDAAFHNMVAACYQSDGGSNASQRGISPNSLRTYAPGIGNVYSLQNIANSNYNALQFTLRRDKAPLTLGVAYTYSHSFDNASDRSDTTFVNSYNIKGNRASSNFDQRHLLHVSFIANLPVHRVAQSFLSAINKDPDSDNHTVNRKPSSFLLSKRGKLYSEGWQLSGLFLFESGIPFTVVNNGSPNGISTLDNAGVANGVGAGSYPDLTGISPRSHRPTGGNNAKSFGPLLLNPQAFMAPQGLTFGNAGRNVLNNPSRWNVDLTLLKTIPIYSHFSAEFRLETFNIFNHTQFRIYNPTLGNQAQNEVSCYGGYASYYSAAGGDGTDCLTGSSFLHPVDAHRPRTVQLALKLSF